MIESSFKISAYTSTADLLDTLGVKREIGLSESEAQIRLKNIGPNLITSEQVHWWQVLIRQFTSPFIYLLILASLIAALLGEWTDVVLIALFVFINALLGFYQEYHSERTVYLLKRFVIGHAKALRAGKYEIKEVDKLVPGDIVQVLAGDIIPADLKYISTNKLEVDESLLTGESAPVIKSDISSITTHGITEAENIGFAGTSVTNGLGIGVVYATGANTYIGQIATLTKETKKISSFEKGLGRFSSFILRTIIITLVLVFLANLFIKGGKISINELLIFSIALAVSVIPEALPVVTTFSLSRGALQLARNKVVVKRLSAIEDLGSVDVLCSDKTGTVTENKLQVEQTFVIAKNLLEYAYLLRGTGESRFRENSFDDAIRKKLTANGFDIHLLSDFNTILEVPFDPATRSNGVILSKTDELLYLLRGAPEVILNHCTHLSQAKQKEILAWFMAQGEDGKRVLAVCAYRQKSKHNQLAMDRVPFRFIGMISFSDPIKKSAYTAIAKAKNLGITIKLLTGDSKEVSQYVARQTGLIQNSSQVITAAEFETLSIADQHQAIKNCHVFARTSPLEKFAIIKLLQEAAVVGFLGEGINDAPGLKISNVGLVVSEASDISREAADIILLKKSLTVIIDGIEEGRRVFANTVKYIKATLASNFGNFYAVAFISLITDYLPMLPVQLLLVNLLSDFPMISIATDSIDPETLKRPRGYNIKDIAMLTTILGLISTVFDFVYFSLFVRSGTAVLRTNWFIASILTELVFLFSVRTHKFFIKGSLPSPLVLILSGLAALLTLAIPFSDLGRHVFRFVPPSSAAVFLITGIVFVYFAVTETVKLAYYRYISPHLSPDN